MKSHHLEFPFVKLLARRVPRRHGPRGRSKVERAMRREAVKSKALRRIVAVVEAVTASRRIRYQDVMSPRRETPAIAEARVLAMGLCCALDVPICIVARAFDRRWHTVYGAEESCSKRYKRSEGFRREWETMSTAVLKQALEHGKKQQP